MNTEKIGLKNSHWKGAKIATDDGTTAIIRLTQGYLTSIDSQDVPKIKPYSWIAMNNHSSRKVKGSIYAYTRSLNRTILMHRLIMGFPEKKQIDHINGNSLDNRKVNLRIVSASENMHNTHKETKIGKFGRGVQRADWVKNGKKYKSRRFAASTARIRDAWCYKRRHRRGNKKTDTA